MILALPDLSFKFLLVLDSRKGIFVISDDNNQFSLYIFSVFEKTPSMQ